VIFIKAIKNIRKVACLLIAIQFISLCVYESKAKGEEVKGRVSVKSDSLMVHSRMSSDSKVVKELKKGDWVILEFEINVGGQDWCGIKEENEKTILGYVPCQYLDRPTVYFSTLKNKKALAEELMGLFETKKMMDLMKFQIMQMQQSVFKQFDLPQDAKEDVAEFQRKMFDKIFSELNWNDMKEEYASLYADTFSEKELREIVDFYRSPAGRKMMEKMPVIVQKAMEISLKKTQNLLPEIEKMTEEFKKQIKTKYKTK
jgi:hypothetical protein